MTPHERIEEAHGLWELAVQRVAALAEIAVELGRVPVTMHEAVVEERAAFRRWQDVSRKALEAVP